MKYLLASLLLVNLNLIMAQDSTNCSCCTEEQKAFDFWVGNWEVKDSSGTLLGHNKISKIENGCGLEENWTGAKGTTGTSISFYNKRAKKWHQSWIDVNGGSILMDGIFENGSMIMYTAKVENEDGTYVQNKTSWTPLDDGRVHHVWEFTKDGGKTWQVVFDGYYSKI